MTDPAAGQTSVNQADYIAALEDDVAREHRARLILTAVVASKDRVIKAYYDKHGDITEQAPDA